MNIRGVGIIGTGFIGPVHIEAIRRLGYPVRGLLGSSVERGQQAADSMKIPCVYFSLDEMLADPEISVVHITSPNRYHFEQCRRSILAGKHVLCEKPLAMNSTETRQLAELARRSEVVCAVCYNIRFYPLCLEAHHRCHSGQAGRMLHVTGSYLQDWLLKDTDFNWRVLAEDGGELRAIADIGTHWLDLVQFITGDTVEEVCADLLTVHPVRHAPRGNVQTFQSEGAIERIPVPIRTEDYGSVLLNFRSGSRGVLTVSQVTAGRKNCLQFEIAGEKLSLHWNSEDPNLLNIGHREKAGELLSRDPALLSVEARRLANYPGGHAEGFPDTFKQLFRIVYDAIESGEKGPIPWPSFEDGHREVLLCEAILKSHRGRCWEKVAG